MQGDVTGDHQDQQPVEPMQSVDPVVLDRGRYLGLLVELDGLPDVPDLGHEDAPFLDGGLAGAGVQVAVYELVSVAL